MNISIIVAASDTPEKIKSKADYICDAADARPTLQKAIEYCIDHTTPGSGVNLTNEPFFEEGHGANVEARSLHKKPR